MSVLIKQGYVDWWLEIGLLDTTIYLFDNYPSTAAALISWPTYWTELYVRRLVRGVWVCVFVCVSCHTDTNAATAQAADTFYFIMSVSCVQLYFDYFGVSNHAMQLCEYDTCVQSTAWVLIWINVCPATAHVLRANSTKHWGDTLHWWISSVLRQHKNTFPSLFCKTTRRARVHIHKQLRMSKTFPIHTHKALREAWKPVCPLGRLIKWVRHDWEAWDEEAVTSGRIEFP